MKEKIKNTAIKTIQIEAEALTGMIQSIDSDFVSAVEAILAMQGRLVVTGIGKSALVAQKIVATLNSTGTPALFMHAADAIHGDLGMIREADIVLCISKSGETPEIRVLVPLLRHRVYKLIGMVSQKESTLGRQADYILHTPVSVEADPNNLAPTTSTTLQMAMGDALATALLAMKGFTPIDFARYHPGGSLGKQLYLRVSDLYPQNEKPRVKPETSLQDTILEMTSKRLGATAVTDDQDTLIGIITDGDLRRMLEEGRPAGDVTAGMIMSPHPRWMDQDELAVKALNLMRENNISQIPVCKDGRYVGMIHLHDLLREGIL